MKQILFMHNVGIILPILIHNIGIHNHNIVYLYHLI